MNQASKKNNTVDRISISIAAELLEEFDHVLADQGISSRSKAVSTMISAYIDEHRTEMGDEIMTGTLNIVFDHSTPGLQQHLNHMQHEYLDEIISCLSVNLTHSSTMSIFLLQGPVKVLKKISNQALNLRGITSGKLILSRAIMPPLHPLPR